MGVVVQSPLLRKPSSNKHHHRSTGTFKPTLTGQMSQAEGILRRITSDFKTWSWSLHMFFCGFCCPLIDQLNKTCQQLPLLNSELVTKLKGAKDYDNCHGKNNWHQPRHTGGGLPARDHPRGHGATADEGQSASARGQDVGSWEARALTDTPFYFLISTKDQERTLHIRKFAVT